MVSNMICEILGPTYTRIECGDLVFLEKDDLQIIARKQCQSHAIVIERRLRETKVYSDLTIAHHNIVGP